MKRSAVLFVDNTSADNLALALAATRPDSLLNVVAIFVTGRAAHRDPNASIEERDNDYSDYIHLLNTKRMVDFMRRAGRTVPVFMGLSVRDTALRTVVPHKHHANEEIYDLWNAWENAEISGYFTQGVDYLRQYRGEKLLILVGGPLSEIAWLQQNAPDVTTMFGTMFVQAGDFASDESTNLLGGKGNSFNGACDALALHNVMLYHDDEIILLPSNITKQPELGFTTPDDIAELGVYSALVDVYRVHYEHSAKKRGTKLFIHDLGLIMLAEEWLYADAMFPYWYVPVTILKVPYAAPRQGEPEQRGTIVIEPAQASNRYVVTWQDVLQYRNRVAAYLQG